MTTAAALPLPVQTMIPNNLISVVEIPDMVPRDMSKVSEASLLIEVEHHVEPRRPGRPMPRTTLKKDPYEQCTMAAVKTILEVLQQIGLERHTILVNRRCLRERDIDEAKKLGEFPVEPRQAGPPQLVPGGGRFSVASTTPMPALPLKPQAPTPQQPASPPPCPRAAKATAARYPRPGSFEVTIYDTSREASRLLFSKYHSHNLPTCEFDLLRNLLPFLVETTGFADEERMLEELVNFANASCIPVELTAEELQTRSSLPPLLENILDALLDLKAALASGDIMMLRSVIDSLPHGILTPEIESAKEKLIRWQGVEVKLMEALTKIETGIVTSGVDLLRRAVEAGKEDGLMGDHMTKGIRCLNYLDADDDADEDGDKVHRSESSLTAEPVDGTMPIAFSRRRSSACTREGGDEGSGKQRPSLSPATFGMQESLTSQEGDEALRWRKSISRNQKARAQKLSQKLKAMDEEDDIEHPGARSSYLITDPEDKAQIEIKRRLSNMQEAGMKTVINGLRAALIEAGKKLPVPIDVVSGTKTPRGGRSFHGGLPGSPGSAPNSPGSPAKPSNCLSSFGVAQAPTSSAAEESANMIKYLDTYTGHVQACFEDLRRAQEAAASRQRKIVTLEASYAAEMERVKTEHNEQMYSSKQRSGALEEAVEMQRQSMELQKQSMQAKTAAAEDEARKAQEELDSCLSEMTELRQRPPIGPGMQDLAHVSDEELREALQARQVGIAALKDPEGWFVDADASPQALVAFAACHGIAESLKSQQGLAEKVLKEELQEAATARTKLEAALLQSQAEAASSALRQQASANAASIGPGRPTIQVADPEAEKDARRAAARARLQERATQAARQALYEGAQQAALARKSADEAWHEARSCVMQLGTSPWSSTPSPQFDASATPSPLLGWRNRQDSLELIVPSPSVMGSDRDDNRSAASQDLLTVQASGSLKQFAAGGLPAPPAIGLPPAAGASSIVTSIGDDVDDDCSMVGSPSIQDRQARRVPPGGQLAADASLAPIVSTKLLPVTLRVAAPRQHGKRSHSEPPRLPSEVWHRPLRQLRAGHSQEAGVLERPTGPTPHAAAGARRPSFPSFPSSRCLEGPTEQRRDSSAVAWAASVAEAVSKGYAAASEARADDVLALAAADGAAPSEGESVYSASGPPMVACQSAPTIIPLPQAAARGYPTTWWPGGGGKNRKDPEIVNVAASVAEEVTYSLFNTIPACRPATR
eukprot:TRINITY_DN29568_c0_g2_i1.p1 TRINITY_DN29568_c0_g2~~TRINITY_DN29568_c0_g2_i1.p1  ORF type:complete len:1223 (-),score=344.89 TRINITY_DN29568_c0_g2_i1:129-3797(-)